MSLPWNHDLGGKYYNLPKHIWMRYDELAVYFSSPSKSDALRNLMRDCIEFGKEEAKNENY